jgi:hypothetical protein
MKTPYAAILEFDFNPAVQHGRRLADELVQAWLQDGPVACFIPDGGIFPPRPARRAASGAN